MQTYSCVCGQTIFFENNKCLSCGHDLGFCPACRNLAALEPLPDGTFRCLHEGCGATLALCQNYSEHHVCNRCVVAPAAAGTLCDCCRFNVTIPDLSVEGNLRKWARLEAAKRWLFYDLSRLGLPYGMENDGIDPPLSFDFKGDVTPTPNIWRGVGKTEKVLTGHDGGRITINIREADDIEREKLRVELRETQRTLIGHFRHEVGHYYWDQLVKGRGEEESIRVFGDHNNPTYAEALERHYKNGPPANWAENYISAYATMHPWEDFAETWAAYLDMVSVLDTAEYQGFGGTNDPAHTEFDAMIVRYRQIGVAMNEINRSMGLVDLLTENFVPPVVEKLRFIHSLALQGRAENGALKPQALSPAASPASSPVASPASSPVASPASSPAAPKQELVKV